MVSPELTDAAKVMEALSGVPPMLLKRVMSKKEKHEQAERVKKFLSLPVPLQQGCLKYAQNIMDAYYKEAV